MESKIKIIVLVKNVFLDGLYKIPKKLLEKLGYQ